MQDEDPWALEEVFGQDLDSSKAWYALSKDICGISPKDFAKNSAFETFPGEIAVVPKKSLTVLRNGAKRPFEATRSGEPYQRQPNMVHVATTFGIFIGFVRQRDFPRNDFHKSNIFKSVFDYISGLRFAISGCAGEGKPATSSTSTTFSSVPSCTSSERKTSPQRDCEINTSLNDIKSGSLGPRKKIKAISAKCSSVMELLSDVTEKYKESLGSVMSNTLIYGSETERDTIQAALSEIADLVLDNGKPLAEMFTSETYSNILSTMKVPDWALLYFKIQAKIPDSAWQTLLNITHLGKSGRKDDTPLLLTKNQIKAIRGMVFRVVRNMYNVQRMDTEFDAFSIDLESALVWAIREQRLYCGDTPDMEFNIKLDGRPLGGRNQVAVGIVPMHVKRKSSESSLSVYPVAIANCKEDRNNFKALLSVLNAQKRHINKHGIIVDGRQYKIRFTATMDYKALLLLLAKKKDIDFVLGGKGFSCEFCAFCDAVRACTDHGADADETCITCLKSKAQIGRCTGLRDDLEFLLEEDLSSINLCSLHCELRNTEQLLGTLGFQAYKIGTLDRLNDALSSYGPEKDRNFNRITIKERKGKQTEISKSDIKVASFSGNTEREILKNFEAIVAVALPLESYANYYMQCEGSAAEEVMNHLTFYEERINNLNTKLERNAIERDFGTHQESVVMGPAVKDFIRETVDLFQQKKLSLATRFANANAEVQADLEPPTKKRKSRGKKQTIKGNNTTSSEFLAAEISLDLFKQVCAQWRDIAECMRKDTSAEQNHDELIDIFDIKCKEWGFLLKHLFGVHLGTGDYGHLVIDHASMLLRRFNSFRHYSGQGFESSHKLHRQLYARATNHDKSSPAQSSDQILTHWYATYLLRMRYMFVEAQKCINSGNSKFHFRGCGWPHSESFPWDSETTEWITHMVNLFCAIFGEDYLTYTYDPSKGTKVSDDVTCKIVKYNHNEWEEEYSLKVPGKKYTNCFLPQSNLKPQSSPLDSESGKMETPKQHKASHSSLIPPDSSGKSTDSTATPQQAKAPHSSLTPPDSSGKSTDSTAIPQQAKAPHSSLTPPDSSGKSTYTAATPQQPPKCKPKSLFVTKKMTGKLSGNVNPSLQMSQMTRGEIADLGCKIPTVDCRQLRPKLQVLHGPFLETDPNSLHRRPRCKIVNDAIDLFRNQRVNNPTGISIDRFGQFSSEGLSLLKKFSNISDMRIKVSEELSWLDNNNDLVTASEREQIEKALWHTKSNQPILRFGKKSIDPMSYSDLIDERYLDNFTLDICIAKYIEEAEKQGLSGTVYLPSEFSCWMNARDKSLKLQKLSERLSSLNSTEISKILAPIHFDQVIHWGLVYIDLPSEQIMFDDGMQLALPASALAQLKNCLDLYVELCPTNQFLKSKFWNRTPVRRFGMPLQSGNASRIGSGSCGMGVIMAARDFIFHGLNSVNNIKWRYDEMNIHRAKLLAKIANGW